MIVKVIQLVLISSLCIALVLDFPAVVYGGKKMFFFVKTTIPDRNKKPQQIQGLKEIFVSILGATAGRVELDRIKHLSWSMDRAPGSLLKID